MIHERKAWRCKSGLLSEGGDDVDALLLAEGEKKEKKRKTNSNPSQSSGFSGRRGIGLFLGALGLLSLSEDS